MKVTGGEIKEINITKERIMMHNKGEEENDIQEGDNFIQDLELV
jgi:hypothetical protein